MSQSLLTAILVFCAVVFGTFAVALVWEVLRDWFRRRQVARRLRPVLEGSLDEASAASEALIRQYQGTEGFFSSLAGAVPGMRNTRNLLQEGDLDWRPETFLLISAGLALGLGLAVFLFTGVLLVAAVCAALGAAAPYFYALRKKKQRYEHFEEQFPEAIDLLTRAIRAGHPLTSGMRMVADEGPPAVAREFGQTFEEQRFGLSFQDALLGLVDRVDLIDVRIFAIAVLVQREVGGNLAEILDNLTETIRGRFYIRRQLRVYTAQGRISGFALAVLPVAVGTVLFLVNPEYFGLLFSTTMGLVMVATALLLQLVGVIWIRNIINIEI